MPTSRTLLSQYRYDPLDRLLACNTANLGPQQRFYCKSRLASEIQGAIAYSFFRTDDWLLAQRRRKGEHHDTGLLATDQPGSVLQFLGGAQAEAMVYSPYGQRTPGGGLSSLLGFNGERAEPVTGHYLLGDGYRAFNPVLMRFNSPDSLSPFDKGRINAYAYCGGDSINRVDPTGHVWVPKQMNSLGTVASSSLTQTGRVSGAAAGSSGRAVVASRTAWSGSSAGTSRAVPDLASAAEGITTAYPWQRRPTLGAISEDFYSGRQVLSLESRQPAPVARQKIGGFKPAQEQQPATEVPLIREDADSPAAGSDSSVTTAASPVAYRQASKKRRRIMREIFLLRESGLSGSPEHKYWVHQLNNVE
ncbi:RHS repeat-associated core domain [Pseudomonas asplenii]|uniref:RHS repeat-associated core domain n=1 Tax=Pseudomonas asplenii TaxID=53407 RepID=A0A0N0VJL3_9PSED|nr:RHS repeat-associated core domain-containing protein [Pseudomonas fuscovaginae]KPA90692.1 RHS repeat-associated core domain [Pseudomonas fuscovaginae]